MIGNRVIGLALLLGLSTAGLTAQQGRGFTRGGGGTSTSRFVSPTVVASWSSHENYADGTRTTLLVLWRGTPGWFSKGGRGRAGWGSSGGSGGGSGGRSGGGSGGGGSYGYQFLSEGGLTFTLEFDYDKRVVKMLNQEISLKEANVVLVDFVDSVNGPTIVDSRWVEPGPAAPPVVPDGVSDPVAGVIRRSPELFEYLQCNLEVTDPVVRPYMAFVCAQMRGPKQ